MAKSETPYDLLGGEEGIRQLSAAFYRAMDSLSEAESIRKMHGESLIAIEEKLFEYLSGWLGGPHLYKERYGTICISAPHEPYAIDDDARDQWLLCMDKALEEVGASERVKAMLKQPLYNVASFLKNRD